MSIEFIGLPGVGKSWLCASLGRALESGKGTQRVLVLPPVDAESRMKVLALKILRASYFGLCHPFRSIRIIALVMKSGQMSRWEAISKTLNLISELGKGKWHRGRQAVFEQGVLQAIWSLALRARDLDLGAMLATAQLYLPRTVIHVECEHDRIHRRLDARKNGRSRVDPLPPNLREVEFEKGEELFQDILDGWNVLQVHAVYKRVQNAGDGGSGPLLTAVLAAVDPAAGSENELSGCRVSPEPAGELL